MALKPRRLKPVKFVNEELRTGRAEPRSKSKSPDIDGEEFGDSTKDTKGHEMGDHKPPFGVPRSRGFTKADSSAVRGTEAPKPRRLKPADESS